MIKIILTLLTSFTVTFVAIPSIIKVALMKHLYDEPDERKSHQSMIPTLGGVAAVVVITGKPTLGATRVTVGISGKKTLLPATLTVVMVMMLWTNNIKAYSYFFNFSGLYHMPLQNHNTVVSHKLGKTAVLM